MSVTPIDFGRRKRLAGIPPEAFPAAKLEARRGRYAAEPVDRLIENAKAAYEHACAERDVLRTRADALEGELRRYREVEAGLSKTLLSAETAAAELRDRAEREASSTLERARRTAAAILAEAEVERERVRAEIDELEGRWTDLQLRFRTLLGAALELLDREQAGEP